MRGKGAYEPRGMKTEMKRRSHRIGRNASIVFRAERVISRRRFAVMRLQTGLMVVAGLVGVIGLLMISVALFFWLTEYYGSPTSGLLVALFNFALSALLFLVASRISVEKELEPLVHVRDLALEDIETEIDGAVDEVADIAAEIRRISRDPLGTVAQGAIGPILASLIKSLKE